MSDLSVQPTNVNVNDVIQVAPVEANREVFHGKLAIVDEVRPWGIKCHIETFTGNAHLRLAWGTFEVIGPAAFVAVDQEPEA